MPRRPIDDVLTLMKYTEWGDNVFGSSAYNLFGGLAVASGHTYTDYATFNPLRDGHWAPFLPIQILDDQTITGNPHMANALSTINPYETAGVPRKMVSRPHDHFAINHLASSSGTSYGFLHNTKPLDGTFHISFNLRTFMRSPQLRSGVPIVNNNLFLLLQNARFLEKKNAVELFCFARCGGSLVYQEAGNISIIG